VVLGFVNILEWPVILSRGLTQLLPLTIAARTLIFALLGWELYQSLGETSGGLQSSPGGDLPRLSAQVTE
jgi:hypothetical protein